MYLNVNSLNASVVWQSKNVVQNMDTNILD